MISRRTVVTGLAASPLLLAATSVAQADTPKALPILDLIGTAPDAAAIASITDQSGTLRALTPFHGRIYYGYGDYSMNSGSISGSGTNVSFYDPSAHAFGTSYRSFSTEAIETIRTDAQGMLIPCIDQLGGDQSVPFIAGTLDDHWSVASGRVDMVHVFDITCDPQSGAILVCGADDTNGGAGVIMVSTNHGASWTLIHRETYAPNPDGFTRIYAMARLGRFVYFRTVSTSHVYAMHRINLDTMSVEEVAKKVSRTASGVDMLAARIQAGRLVQTSSDRAYLINAGFIYTFDGINPPTRVSAAPFGTEEHYVDLFLDDHGTLTLLTFPTSDSSQYVCTIPAGAGKIIPAARYMPTSAAAQAESVCQLDGRFYVGTNEGHLFATHA